MDAIVTAGGIPQPDEPLYPYAGGNAKALIDVAGKPMIQWVLDALSQARSVENVILIGLPPRGGLTCRKPLYYLSNQGRMLANIVAGVDKALELNPSSKYVLVVSSDIPAIQPGMIDWLIDTCMQTRDDLYYGVCPREVMEKRFPNSKRTYTPLKDMDVCGADMNVVHVSMAHEHQDVWETLIAKRKNPAAQALAMGGVGMLFRLATRQLTLEEAVARVVERIGITGRAIVWPYAEPCMDVDKPHQLEMMRADLARRQRRDAAPAMKRKPVAKARKKPAVRARPAKKPAKTNAKAKPARKAARPRSRKK